MIKKLLALSAIAVLLLAQRPHAQGPSTARIYFVDIGTGASTLIVSPTGKTLLVDGGPDGSSAKITALLNTLGIAAVDYTVVTHYHIDHISGVTELINAGRVNGIALDAGDGPDVQPPGTSTSASSTRGHYLNYKAAILGQPAVTRQTATPGMALDLGGGMRATIVASGGQLLSGGQVAITNDDLNSESVSVLVEYNNFDYLVSGDLTGGGSTATAKTPDVETFVAQMVGDVDVVQLNHHGSTTANNQRYLSALKAEVAFAQTGENNTFGHPNRESVNKYLNTPVTNGSTFAGTGVPTPGAGPVFYQNEASPSGDDRVTQQGYTGAASGNAGNGTVLLQTDGTTTYSLMSFDDGGVRLAAGAHTYAVDGISAGLTSDFRPTVQAETTPAVPLPSDTVTIAAAVNDREAPVSSVALQYALNGTLQSPVAMTFAGGLYQAAIPPQPDGTRVDYAVTATAGGQTTTASSGYFSGTTPVSSIRALNANGEPLFTGYTARIQGAVTASGYSSGTNDDYVQDATGGVNVYRSSDTPTAFTSTAPGQIVDVAGRINFLGGRLRLDTTESLEKVTSPYGIAILASGAAPTPMAVTIAGLNANPEAFEGQLVSIANVQIVAGAIPASPQSLDAFAVVSDGTGSFSLKIDHDTDLEGFSPAATFTAIGIVQQDDYLRPFNTGYNLAPRSRVDLGAAAATPPPLLTIGDARVDELSNADGTPGADFIPDRLNQVVRVQGNIVSIDFRGGNGIEYYIQDATGGLDLFASTTNFGPFAIGDAVEATGAVTHFNGLTELAVSAVSFIAGGSAPAPQVITISQLADGGGEAFEGELVTIANVSITSGLFPAPGASGNVTIADATGATVLRVDSDTNIDGSATPTGAFSVTGILGQFAVAPFDSGYQLLPRSLSDIVSSGGGGPALTALPGTLAFPATTLGNASIAAVSIANNSASTLTLTTPFVITGTDASQFSVGLPGTTTLAAGSSTTANVTFLPTSTGAKAATLTIAASGGNSATVALTGTGQNAGGGGGGAAIVISEFRFRGTLGANDEFVEIYNNSDNAADIGGLKLFGSNNNLPPATSARTSAGVPAGTILPPRAHYLFVNTTATTGYSGAAPGNLGYTTGIVDDGGIAIIDASNVVLDQVGLGVNSAYKEGTTLASLGTSNLNRGYERKPGGAAVALTDTANNASDFQILTPSTPQNIVLTAAPSAIAFGSVGPGDSRSVTVTIKNLLLNSVTLTTPFAISGGDAASFLVGAPGVTTLPAGGTTTVTVTFQPNGTGAKSAALVVTSSSSGTVSIPLSGTGTAGLSVSPASIDFGTVTPGSSAASTVTLDNSDAVSITLTPPFAITGANAADFNVGAPGTTVIPGGGSTSVAVAFQPATPGPKTATLQITSAGGSPRTVALSGVGTCPVIAVGGALPSGRVNSSYAGLVTASGSDGPFTFALAGGTLPDGLALTGLTGAVSGTPTAVGSSTFTVQATAANGCSGTGSFTITIAPPVLTAAPTSLSFGIVAVSSSASLSVTLTNNTAGTITLTPPFAVTGTHAAQFAAGAPATTTLAAGGSTTVSVTFTPAAAGVKSATLTATSSGGGSVSVPLSGVGSAATAVVISEFRTVGPGGGNDEFVEIYNNTNATIAIGGYTMRGSNSGGTVSIRATVPAGTILPAHEHYLFVNSAAYSGAAPGNVGYGTGITNDGGVALFDNLGNALDQVGMSPTSAYKEGTTLTQLTTNVNRGYERKPGQAVQSLQDTDDNTTDFVLITPSTPSSLGLTVTPIVIFGSVPVSSSASQSATIKNNYFGATVTLTGIPFAIDGPDAAEFVAGAPATTSMAGGTSTSVPVTFSPATTGSKNAALHITSTNGGSPVVALTGLGTCPVITVSGALPAAEFGAAYTATVTASGAPGAFTFAVTTGAPPAGLTLDAAGVLSGTPSSLGPSTFTVTATGIASCTGSAAFTVSVEDHTAPTIDPHGNETAEATSGAGAAVGYTPPATHDAVDLDGAASCSPAPGSVFPLGTSTVTCSATDAAGNHATDTTFTVTVEDHTAPTIDPHGNETAEATGAAGTTVGYTSPATHDAVDPDGVASCSPASGSTFAVGSTTVTCSAVDAAGNHATDTTFTVTVTDHTPPAVVAGSATVEQTSPAGATATFSSSASDLVDGPLTPTCTPPSGSTFPSGATTVTCEATDAHGNTGSATGTVTVQDTINPTVTYSGNAGTYAINQTVNITCTAADTGSGVASTTCANITGPAYSFGLGPHTYSATATDVAGHVGSGSTTFTVGVTFTSLQALVASFSTNADVTAGLNAKLQAASNAPNANARAGQLNAFKNQVNAQTGKALTTQQAALLLQLVQTLY